MDMFSRCFMYGLFLSFSFPPVVRVRVVNQVVSSSGLEIIKHFSCSAQLRLKFQRLINTKIAQIN